MALSSIDLSPLLANMPSGNKTAAKTPLKTNTTSKKRKQVTPLAPADDDDADADADAPKGKSGLATLHVLGPAGHTLS